MNVCSKIKSIIDRRHKSKKSIESSKYLKMSLNASNENGMLVFPEMAAYIYEGIGRSVFSFSQVVKAKDSRDRFAKVDIRIEMLD